MLEYFWEEESISEQAWFWVTVVVMAVFVAAAIALERREGVKEERPPREWPQGGTWEANRKPPGLPSDKSFHITASYPLKGR
ncbi:MAG: hypothetical protein KAS60_06495 [Thermoplasmata archaeon]|nr:hypothetical protein [Thermoplasmata archaeon]